MIEYLRIGVVTSPHGVKGEVKVYVTTDDESRFQTVKQIILTKDGVEKKAVIQHARPFKEGLMIVKLSGVNDRNTAELLRGWELMIHRSQSAPLAENEFFIGDLLGMEVVLEDGSVFGELTDVYQTGANDSTGVTVKEYVAPSVRPEIVAARAILSSVPVVGDSGSSTSETSKSSIFRYP